MTNLGPENHILNPCFVLIFYSYFVLLGPWSRRA